ncbi:MAG: hypothetical protein CMO44_14475, partial [Verrucomicrobiales bacterium]|nr:hypothetical protein [Verrucomicrobiales bacterium]
DDLYMHQCAYKCSGADNSYCRAGDDDGALKFVKDKDGIKYEVPCFCPDDAAAAGDNDVCGDSALCEALCDSSAECYGFHMSTSSTKCVLLKSECMPQALTGLASSPDWHYFAKMDPEAASEGCPMGLAVEAKNFEDTLGNCPEINDQYNPAGEIAKFVTDCANLEWNADACGWTVSVATPPPAGTSAVKELCDAPQCLNKIPEANWLYGFSGASYDELICSRTEQWIAGGQCTQNALWRALCPEECVDVTCAECEAWTADNTAAADALVEMMGITVAGVESCANLYQSSMCTDPVVAIICEATCDAGEVRRRLSAETKAELAAHRERYSAAFLSQMAEIERKLSEESERKLQADHTVLYASWDPTSPPTGCDPSMDPDYKSITTTPFWYEWEKWKQNEVDIRIQPVCDMQPTFKTHSDQYCNTNNMVINNPAMTGDLCFNKCNPDGTFKDPLAVDDGTCAGTDPAFNRFSNALCVTRPKCEEYSALPGVWGFEMHKSVPRCYLVDEKCPPPEIISSSLYDQVEKSIDFDTYVTGYGKACPNSGGVSTASGVAYSRETCEDLCTAEAECYGFNYYFVVKSCEFFYISLSVGDRNANSMCSSGTFEYASSGSYTTPNLEDAAGVHFVERKLVGESLGLLWRKPCDVDVVAGLGVHFNGAGRYTRSQCDDLTVKLCFESPGGQYHLVWADQDLIPPYLGPGLPVSRKCAGWVIEDFTASKFMFTTFSPSECPEEPLDPDAAIAAGYTKMHEYAPNGPPDGMGRSMEYVCKSYPVCGVLQTCVMAKNRFHTEMVTQYGSPTVADIAGYLPYENSAMLADENFRPKTLISVDLSTAFLAAGKEEFATQLYRNVPGHHFIKLGKLQNGAVKAIIKMASADGTVMGEYIYTAMENDQNGEYVGFEPWYTDIIRIELFDADGRQLRRGIFSSYTYIEIEFYAPGVPELTVFTYMPLNAGYLGGMLMRPDPAVQSPGKKDYFFFEVKGSGDYVATTMKKCGDVPSIPNAAASMACPKNEAGDKCSVVCMQGYVPKGELVCDKGAWVPSVPLEGLCALPEEYEAEMQFFRLAARSRMDYGWRIRQVRAFSNAECYGKGLPSVTITAPATSQIGESPLDNKGLTDVNKVSDESKCSSNQCEDYWSMGLNVNPYSVDETHDPGEGGAFLEFTVASDEPVLCVEVISRTIGPDEKPRQYYPSDAVLLRGFADDTVEGGDVFRTLTRSVTHIEGWTESWTASAEEGDAAGAVHRFTTSCGQADQRIFGELLMQQAGVTSACHCKQLCIDTWQGTDVKGGCLSWNYQVEPFPMCFLQSTIKPMAAESCVPDTNVISGFTGLRITGVKTTPSTVLPGEPFTLKVEGINMPAEENAFLQKTTPTRQRVKLVPHMTGGEPTSCADGEVAATVEGIGCSHPFFCAPRPTSYSMSDATWTALKIHGTSNLRETYTVCYNRGFTYDRYEWHAIDTITVTSGVFVFSAPEVMRKTATFDLAVKALSFTVSNPLFYNVKFVKSYFDCAAVKADAKLFTVGKSVAGSTVTFGDIVVYDEATLSFAEVGKYKVCLDTGDGTWMQIPGESGEVYLEISAEDGYSTHSRGLYSYQKISGKSGAENDFTLEGFRLFLPSDSAIAFFNGGCGKSTGHTGFSATVDSKKSTADGYVFTGTPVEADHPAGDYNVCFCNDQTNARRTYGQNVNRYKVTENSKCTAGHFSPQMLSTENVANVCAIKCSRGCVGPDCLCDGFNLSTAPGSVLAALGDDAAPLCLDAPGCKAACEAEPDCTGYDFVPAKNLCYLLDEDEDDSYYYYEDEDDSYYYWESCDPAYDGDQVHWDKLVGYTSCTDAADFETHLGTVSLTTRVEVGMDWVLTPGETSSIEVLGHDLDWKEDRIMVIDYTGICGVSSAPKDDVMLTVGFDIGGDSLRRVPFTEMRAAHWVSHLSATFNDNPAEVFPGCGQTPPLMYQEGCANCAGMAYMPERGMCMACFSGVNMRITESMLAFMDGMEWCPEEVPPVAQPTVAYTRVADSFCAGNNAPTSTHKDQCYSKCITNGCEGEGCFCGGVLQGYDDAESDALCLDEDTCLDVCAMMEDCVGIDMHNDLDRCFLNLKASEPTGSEESCEFYVDYGKLTADASYSYMYKQGRRLESRKLIDHALELLAFEGIQFFSGGQYKACFCDVDTLETGKKYCKEASDYKIEIGTIHVSGVSCLVENKKFQRGECVNQSVGGLRCYADKAPAVVEPAGPTLPQAPPTTVVDDVPDAVASSFCLYGPEEETRDNPLCL